jgi:hypothetical protein
MRGGRVPHGNDGVFATASNAGTGMFYGTAAMTDTLTLTVGQKISVTCNAGGGLGTYVADACLNALKVSKVA